jgi:predicted phage terminase large subunit-like protein
VSVYADARDAAFGTTTAAARHGPAGEGQTYAEWYRRTMPQGYAFARHIEYLCALVDDVVAGRITRLAVSVPPGHAKSSTITHRLPVYWGERHPADAVVFTGYSQRFAEKHLSQPAREIAQEMGVLSPDATALDEWRLANGARLVTRGVGNPPTGVNPISLLVCDDPIKSRAEAASPTVRENVWQWWTGSIVQRFWPRTRAIIIATRWHEDDLIGRLKATDDPSWTFINLPALAGAADPLGRAPGEALWPEAKPATFLRALRQEMGEYEFEAVFQGNPTPREGSVFKVSQLSYVDAADVPRLIARCRAWDLAATEGAGDYTAGVLMGRGQDGYTYVLDVVRGQWDSSLRNQRMKQAAAQDGVGTRIRLPQDPGQAGKDQVGSLTRMLSGFPVKALPVSGDKETRADPFAAQVNAGNVRIVRGAWNAAFVEELRAFPAGRHDDGVDAAADAFNEVAPPRVRPTTTGRVESRYSY